MEDGGEGGGGGQKSSGCLSFSCRFISPRSNFIKLYIYIL